MSAMPSTCGTSSRSTCSSSGSGAGGSGCARSTRRRPARSTSTKRTVCSSASAAAIGGDAITFVREIEHLDFVGAVEWLAGKAGITIRYTERREDEGRKRRGVLLDAMAKAVAWYHERLLHGADAGTARGYVRSRGLDGDAVRQYQLGWAPAGWDELARALRLPDDVLVESGLGFLNRRGGQTDAFRDRLLFPIFDVNGDPVAFGGRLLPGGDGPKYKNSPAQRDLRQVEGAVRAELGEERRRQRGRGDRVRGLHRRDRVRRGRRSPSGRHLRHGAHRGAPAAAAPVRPPGRSRVRRRRRRPERRRPLLPVGARSRARRRGRRAPGGRRPRRPRRTAIRVRCRSPWSTPCRSSGSASNRVLESGVARSPEGRARAAEQALAVIAEHPSELVRDQYVMQVADRCRLDPDQLRARLRAPCAVRVVDGSTVACARRACGFPTRRRSTRLLALIHAPDAVDEVLMQDPELTETMFTDLKNLAAFRALASTATIEAAIAAADPGRGRSAVATVGRRLRRRPGRCSRLTRARGGAPRDRDRRRRRSIRGCTKPSSR